MRHERMSDEFEKWHLDEGLAIHHFTGPDKGGPHDHPWDFTSTVLKGMYIERIYHPELGSVGLTTRIEGDTFRIHAEHIHEIAAVSEGGCYTLVRFGPHRRTTHFWRFENGKAQCREWNGDWHKPGVAGGPQEGSGAV